MMEKGLRRESVAREAGPRLRAWLDCQPQTFAPEPAGERKLLAIGN
jgi:hypothetical protein